MIQITILTEDGITAARIAEFLVEENLVINAKLIEKVKQYNKSASGVVLQDRFMISAIAKGLLFSIIDKRLKETFPKKEIEFHAVLIMDLNWQQAEKLVAEMEKV